MAGFFENAPANGDAAIRCVGLSRSYGEIQALKNLNLCVPYGSIYGFLGRNGAGKTTTIRILTGLAQPSAGSAWVAGIEATNPDSNARQRFGYLPQSPAFYRWMTPNEYLDYAARLFHLDEKERKQRIAEILQRVDLQSAARRRIGGFSGGMIQRLGIAQALIHRPPVLFLDEPTSALDPAGRHEVLELIASLSGQVTVFFSTHILTDVERICDTIAIIHKGELLLESDREALLNQYAINAVEIEIDNHWQLMDPFVASLKAQPWVDSVRAEKSLLHITVTDLAQGKQAILPLAAGAGLVINRLEWVRPSLEDIFLKISS
ncbi:MAG: ABC transporter ATP-binding protein [Anaerolineaceae bacterium]|nr:ABC transporter ATP-binding protein [Anaerolineaceae bacterium]